MTQRNSTVESAAGARPAPRLRRPRRTAQQSREQIMRAATAEFAAHGLAGARISRIVQKAGTNPRMIYEHFGSKSALYVAALENALAELRSEELGLDVEHLDPVEGLLRLFDFMNAHFERSGYLVRLLTTEKSDQGALYEEVFADSRDVVSGSGDDQAAIVARRH